MDKLDLPVELKNIIKHYTDLIDDETLTGLSVIFTTLGMFGGISGIILCTQHINKITYERLKELSKDERKKLDNEIVKRMKGVLGEY